MTHPVEITRLGDREVSRIEPLLPKCKQCGADAEMRTASWTWVDYIVCSKRCGVTTYPPKGKRYDGKSLDEIWDSNLEEWYRLNK